MNQRAVLKSIASRPMWMLFVSLLSLALLGWLTRADVLENLGSISLAGCALSNNTTACEQAKSLYSRAAESGQSYSSIFWHLGMADYFAGKPNLAAMELRVAVEAGAGGEVAIHQLGDLYLAEGDLAEARKVWEGIPQAATRLARECVADVWERGLAGQIQVDKCRLATDLSPQSPEVFEALGRLLFWNLGQHDKGWTAYEHAMALRNANEPVWRDELNWVEIAHALDVMGDSIRAADLLEEKGIQSALADAIRANALRIQGRPADAVQMYQRAIEQSNNDPWFYHGLALAYLEMGDQENAITTWQQALALDPSFEPALRGIGSLEGE